MDDAAKAFFASAPSGTYLIETVELVHADFADRNLNPIGFMRLVKDHGSIVVTLEDNATTATFEPYSFELLTPSIEDRSNPETQIIIDNVDRWAINNIERSLTSLEPIELIYRTYLSTNLGAPIESPPLRLILSDVSANVYQVQATARFADLSNKNFPNGVYSSSRFPALAL